MKIYYYLLFRIYMFYEKFEKENVVIYTLAFSTVLIGLNLITIYLFLNFYDIITQIPSKTLGITLIIFLGLCNYFFVLKNKIFLEQNFEKDRKGGVYVVIYIILTFSFTFLMAKFNRERILGY